MTTPSDNFSHPQQSCNDGSNWFRPDLLAGRHALITGGGTGLGLAMARAFLHLGAEVTICGRRAEVLQTALSDLAATTDRTACSVTIDLRDADAPETLLAACAANRPVDILVNNAAANFIARSETLSPRAIDSILDISLRSALRLTMAAGQDWITRGTHGTVLSIVTSYAWHGSPFVVPSAVAKAGLLAMTRSLASEWGHHGIRLNALAPGSIPTQGAWSRLLPDPSAARQHETNNALGRAGTPAEIAALASFMVSDAAAYMTGDCITLDGGRWGHMAGTFSFLHALDDAQWSDLREKGK